MLVRMLCEGKGCINIFEKVHPKQRRCKKCHQRNRPYKDGTINLVRKAKQRKRRKKNPMRKLRNHKTPDEKKLKQEIHAGLHVCKECGTKQNLSIDHIIKLSQNGSRKRANLQVLCVYHNVLKN